MAGPAEAQDQRRSPEISGFPSSNLRKYQTTNPVVQFLIRRFLRRLLDDVSRIQPSTIIDLGCGEGIVARVILDEFQDVEYRGYDNNAHAIDEARQRTPEGQFCCTDIFDVEPGPEPPGLVLCLEVMEHIEDADSLLEKVSSLNGRHVILSVPWEPFFRLGNFCRGRHLRRFGNHPEHVHCFGMMSLRRALSRHFSDVRIEPCFPWLFGICRRKTADKR